jgi:hypothetical protein
MKNNRLKRKFFLAALIVLGIGAVGLMIYILIDNDNRFTLFAVPIFMLIFAGISIISFYLRFRLRLDQYEYHNAEYEGYRADIEEKIRELQKAINKDNEHWRDNNHLVLSGLEHNDALFEQFGVSSQQEIVPNSAFMLMPFNPDAVKVYDQCKKTVENIGMHLSKSDDVYIEGDLLKHIVSSIVKSELIIANLDGKNPNVFYELGIAHTIRKPTILITSYKPKDVPFNLQSRNIIFYTNLEELDKKLRKAVEDFYASRD